MTKDPHASALGKRGKGKLKTLTPAERARRTAQHEIELIVGRMLASNAVSATALPSGSAFGSSALVLLLSRWRDIAEMHVLQANKWDISASGKIESLAYARGIHDLANRIEDELRRAGEKENEPS